MPVSFARAVAIALFVPLFAASSARAEAPGEVNIYSYRQPYLTDTLLKERDRGTHVNISGVVVAKYAPHKDNEIKLLEFLASDKGQEMYADLNNQYPVKDRIPWSTLIQSWGDFKPDPISLNEMVGLRKKASELVDEVGFRRWT